ncbi:MAG: tRNA (adenosine(37)-N6)-threonylcarbamoyltransferase complex dimerization subunit type 1 TsaB [Ignavibacteria bacterium RBG_13_36_8]|nr:MAG: tRNA (adenosine(37)-N6)-threonylcarbamoyltransferase complex dimerization subunit type 1 TsaB [Ignavibacteria bacterium RBG_13_36_8]
MNEKLPILAVETSGDICSVAVMFDKKTFSEYSINQKHIHSQKLLDLIKTTFNDHGIKLENVGHIAVSVGPGSFTGLRIGMAAVKGLAFGASLPVVPVPTFEALALRIVNYLPEKTKFIIANNVNLEELYYCRFIKENSSYNIMDALKLVKKIEFSQIIKKGDVIFGNFHSYNPLISIAFPSALDIAKWSYFFGKDLLTFEYDYIEPNYLKKFDIKVKK